MTSLRCTMPPIKTAPILLVCLALAGLYNLNTAYYIDPWSPTPISPFRTLFRSRNAWDDIPDPLQQLPFTLSANFSPNTLENAYVPASLRTILAPLARMPAPNYRPTCVLSPEHLARYAPLEDEDKAIFLAINLIDAQWPLVNLLHELPVILSFLGTTRVFVSILENGSTDKTPGLLGLLADVLDAYGCAYKVTVFLDTRET